MSGAHENGRSDDWREDLGGARRDERREEVKLPPIASLFGNGSFSEPSAQDARPVNGISHSPYLQDRRYEYHHPAPPPAPSQPPPPPPPPPHAQQPSSNAPPLTHQNLPSLNASTLGRPEPPLTHTATHYQPIPNVPPHFHTEPSRIPIDTPEPRNVGRQTSVTPGASNGAGTDSSGSAKVPPRVLDVKDINGESHYILEDGSRMKTEIAGERVNPAWGITKAGKPRKRLAQACVACREKKVKCEPASDPREPKCGQCSRLNRVCKKPKELALEGDPNEDVIPQGLRDQALATTTSSMSLSDHSTSTSGATVMNNGGAYMTPNGFPQTGTIVTVNDKERPGDIVLKKLPPANPAPAPRIDPTTKKRGHGPDHYQDLKENPNVPPAVKRRKPPTGAAKVQSYWGPEAPEHVNLDGFQWDVDPFIVDPEATLYFVELMFYHRASGAYTFLPKDHYKDWIRHNRDKSPDDRMALYAFMALGAQFSQDKHAKAAADRLGQIATDAETDRSGNFSLQLAHTRITLLLYYFSRAQWGLAFEFTASTSMAVKALQWHQEEHVRNVNEDELFHEYGFTATQLMECRRRTFWLVYMVDRYNAFSYGSLGFIQDTEIFLQLPMPDEDFFHGNDVYAPKFFGDTLREPHKSTPSSIALLIDIVSIWGSVTSHAYLSKNQAESVYEEMYKRYFDFTVRRVREWEAMLPEYFRYSPENTQRAVRDKRFGDYFILHAVSCVVGMKLGRLGRFVLLDDDLCRRNIRISMYWAHRLLKIVSVMNRYVHQKHTDDIDFALSQPFPGYAILSACDTLGAGGTATDLARLNNNQLNDAKSVVGQFGHYWEQSRRQWKVIDSLQGVLSAQGMGGSGETDHHRNEHASEKCFLPDSFDIVYGVRDEVFFDAVLNWDTENNDPLANYTPVR